MPTLRALARGRPLAILVVGAAIAGASALGGVWLATASAQTVQVQQSTNWAGYLVDGNRFSSVSGSWVVPSAKSSSEGYSAFWVGLGGSSSTSSALEQVGTESDYVGGRARYLAWYELPPSSPVTLKISIHSGDRISSRVSVSGTRVTVKLSDLTTGRSVTKTLHMSHPDTSSAEWIAEAPSVETAGGFRTLSLADFGKVTFTKASATAGGHAGSIADSHWQAQRVQLVSEGGGFGGPGRGFSGPGRGFGLSGGNASTSSLSGNGSSFSVAWSSGSPGAGY